MWIEIEIEKGAIAIQRSSIGCKIQNLNEVETDLKKLVFCSGCHTGSPYYRLLEKYFVQELFSFLSHTLCCSSYVLSRVIIREIKNLKGAQGNKGGKSKAKREKKEKEQGLQLS